MASQRASTMSPHAGRQSPFQRQPSNATSPASRNALPHLPTNSSANSLSPAKGGPLSAERQSPFARRPSLIEHKTDARPTTPTSPSRLRHVDIAPTDTANHPRRDLGDSSTLNITAQPPKMQSLPNLLPTSHQLSTRTSIEGLRAVKNFETVSTTPMTSGYGVKSSVAAAKVAPSTSKKHVSAANNMQHMQAGLLRSMRESFEVMDSSNSGNIDSAALASMLEQMGMDNSPAVLREFFPQNAPAQLNLARYLDILSASLADLSQSDELQAAFEAFDIDDSGQIDIAELRRAMLNVHPEPGEKLTVINQHDLDKVLAEYSSKRAFGAKGVKAVQGRAEVFRYRDFMVNLNGGSPAGVQGDVVVA